MLFGAIDVGTNSIHLLLVELDTRMGTSRTILKEREMVRLGAGDGLQRGLLDKKAFQRGVTVIAKLVQQARAAGATSIRVVATSAVREAANRDQFVAAVAQASGITVEILSDVDEARLIHLGVSRGFPLYDRIACVIDVGGGSTELIVGDGERPFSLHSVKLGSLRLYQELAGASEKLGPKKAYQALRERIHGVLQPVAEQLRSFHFDTMIGTSGTITGLAALDAAKSAGNGSRSGPQQRAHGYVLSLERLVALQEEMLALGPAARRKMPGMNPRRSDIIVAGNAIVIAAMEELQRQELTVCERALRDGIVAEYLEHFKHTAPPEMLSPPPSPEANRFEGVMELAKRFGSNGVHENKVATLAIELFDLLADLHGLETQDRDILFAAGMLHDVGLAIHSEAHHKHGAYIVRNARIEGWRTEEVELIALLVRYHRRALPKPTHVEWTACSEALKKKVLALAALLRIADGLDTRGLAVVEGVEIARSSEGIELRVRAQQDVRREVAAARFKSDLFARAFSIPLRVTALQWDDVPA